MDFTSMSTDEVMLVLRSKKKAGENICGRFRASHLTPVSVFKPEPIVNRIASRTRIFLAALVLVFSTSLFTACSTDPVVPSKEKTVQVNTPPAKGITYHKGVTYLPGQIIPAAIQPEKPACVITDDIYMVQGIEPYYDPNDTLNY